MKSEPLNTLSTPALRITTFVGCLLTLSFGVSTAAAQTSTQALELAAAENFPYTQQQLQQSDKVQLDETDVEDSDADVIIDGPPAPIAPNVVSRDSQGRVTVRAVRLPEGLNVDGRLDDPIYSTVPSVTDFIQQEPDEGEPATDKTELWIFFDDKNVYVSGRNWDTGRDKRLANELRRDNRLIGQNDNFSLVLDTFYDRRNGYLFQTNPLGGLRDGLITDERNANYDWSTVWDVRVHQTDQYWDVEMEIPFKSLRFKPGEGQIWGINIRRGVESKKEDSYLSPIPRSAAWGALQRVSDAATLVGISVPSNSRNLEIKPFGISSVTGTRNTTNVIDNNFLGDVGFDAKYGLTQGLTADFTVNTDFAQVEDDMQQVNLTRFSLFFPEKREFFLEGQGIFNFGGVNSGWGRGGETPLLFFSRNIGLANGQPVTMRAGSRVTGRAGRYSVGLLNIQTSEDQSLKAAATNFSVVRLRRDLFRRSTIGIMATNRSASLDGNGANQAYGVDANFAFFQNLQMSTFWAGTNSPGLSGDTTSYQGRIQNEGDKYGFTLSHLKVGDNFNPGIGFVRRDDFRKNRAELKFSPRAPSIALIRKFEMQASVEHIASISTGTLETRQYQGRFQVEMESGDRIIINTKDQYEFLPRDFTIADGVVLGVGSYRWQNTNATYMAGPQRKLSGRVTIGTGGFYSGHSTHFSADGRVEVTPKLSMEPRFQRNWIALPEGTFATNLLSTRATYTMSARLFAGALVQYNSSNDSINTNVRFRWEYEPGSDLFVVYSEGRATDHHGFPLQKNRGFVVKFTKLFRF